MQTFGNYQVVSEVASTGPVTVYAARLAAAGGGATHIVKAIRTYDDFAPADVITAWVEMFQLRVARLKTLAKASPATFEEVLEEDRTQREVYYVAVQAPLTAQGLIDTRRDLASEDLLGLLGGLNDAVAVIRRGGFIAHGNLKPTNVLLTSTIPAIAKVRVTDPLVASKLDDSSPREDIRAIGEILFALVAHRDAPKGTQIRTGDEWSRLGVRGEPLRKLCEELLNPTAGQELTPEAVKARLEGISRLRDKMRKGPILAAVAAMLLIGGGAAAYVLFKPSGPTIVLKDDPEFKDRAAEFEKEVTQARTAVPADATFAPIVAAFKTLEDSKSIVLSEPITDSTRSAAKEQFDQLSKDFEQLKAFVKAQGEWTAVAGKITAPLDEATAARDKRMPEIVKTISEMPQTPEWDGPRKVGGEVGTEYEQHVGGLVTLEQTLKAKVEANQATLAGYTPRSKKSDPLPTLAAPTSPDEAIAQQITAAGERLIEINQRFTIWNKTSSEVRLKLNAAVEATTAKIVGNDAISMSRDEPNYRKRASEAVKKLAEDEDLRNEEQLKSVAESVNTFISSVKAIGDVKAPAAALPGESKLTLQPLVAQMILASQASMYESNDAKPKQAVDKLKSKSGGAGGEVNMAQLMDVAIAQTQVARTSLDAQVGQLAELWRSHIALDTMLANGFALNDLNSDNVSIESLLAAVKQSEGDKLLTTLTLPMQETSFSSVLKEQASTIITQLEALTLRAAAVKQTQALRDRAALQGVLKQEEEAAPGKRNLSRMLTAWDALIAADYPATLAEWEQVKAAKPGLLQAAAAAPDPQRKQAIEKRVNDSVSTAWFALANERLMGTAKEDLRGLFTDTQMAEVRLMAEEIKAKLKPHAALNLARIRLEVALQQEPAAGDRKAQNTRLGQLLSLPGFFAELDAQAGEVGGPAQTILDKFRKPRQGDGFVNLAEEGPGKPAGKPGQLAGEWVASELAEDGSRVTYTYTNAKGLATTLVFGKIAGDDNSATYLCTHEVSVGVFRAMLESRDQLPGAGGNMNIGKLFPEPGELPKLIGPRAWTYFNDKAVSFRLPSPRSPVPWCNNETSKLLNGAKFLVNPAAAPLSTLLSPITFLSDDAAIATAALLNCRLPTASEMRAVLAGGEPQDSNRRDETWGTQFNHIKIVVGGIAGMELKIAEFLPNHRIFRPKDALSGAEDSAFIAGKTDGSLWFQSVGTGSTTTIQGLNGVTFNHLYGNVAEFVTETGKPLVMGASALSAPTVSPDAAGVAVPGETDYGYSDVGFRLAFTTAGGGMGGAGNTAFAQAFSTLDKFEFFSPPEK